MNPHDFSKVIRCGCFDLRTFQRLGYIDGNKQYEHFWCKNWFIDTGIRYQYIHNDRDGAQTERFWKIWAAEIKKWWLLKSEKFLQTTAKLTKHTKQCIQVTQLYKTRKNGPASPKGSETAGKARNPKKRAFSLPHISYNLHYTKYYKNQKQRPPSSCLLPFQSFNLSIPFSSILSLVHTPVPSPF